MYDKSIELYHDTPNCVIKVNISIDKDFKPNIGTRLENFGYIQVESPRIDDGEICLWDNINFFLKAPEVLIKADCKRELTTKGLYYKGFFKDLQKMINELVDAGYLTRDCKKDY